MDNNPVIQPGVPEDPQLDPARSKLMSTMRQAFGAQANVWVTGTLIVAIIVGAVALAVWFRPGGLGYSPSSAGCYGYGCGNSAVFLYGRAAIPSYGYSGPFAYRELTVLAGSKVELTWAASNVDYCAASWTKFAGIYMPPTVYSQPITSAQSFKVDCFRKGRVAASDKFQVTVKPAPKPVPTPKPLPVPPRGPGKTPVPTPIDNGR